LVDLLLLGVLVLWLILLLLLVELIHSHEFLHISLVLLKRQLMI
jgi:hypothetical protein